MAEKTNGTGVNGKTSGLLFLRAQTSVHAGTGASIGSIDLPVQRETHTAWPMIQSSSLKGVLRDTYRLHLIGKGKAEDREKADAHVHTGIIFGPKSDESGEMAAGALVLTDARILAFPVRSARGVFVWVTSPQVIERLQDDLRLAGIQDGRNELEIPDFAEGETEAAYSSKTAVDNCWLGRATGRHLITENLGFGPGSNENGNTRAKKIADWMAQHACGLDPQMQPGLRDPRARFAVIPDDAFTHLVKYATEVSTRIALNYETKTVAGTALFTMESLPPESLLYCVALAQEPRKPGGAADLTRVDILPEVRDAVVSSGNYLQVGGDETTGKGWCSVRLATAEALTAT